MGWLGAFGPIDRINQSTRGEGKKCYRDRYCTAHNHKRKPHNTNAGLLRV